MDYSAAIESMQFREEAARGIAAAPSQRCRWDPRLLRWSSVADGEAVHLRS
jgi:hypothetical protein